MSNIFADYEDVLNHSSKTDFHEIFVENRIAMCALFELQKNMKNKKTVTEYNSYLFW